MRAVGVLVPSARNARKHRPEQVAKIARSIEAFGWTTPVLIDEADAIIAGHGRVLAARKLGIDDVPVIVARGWTAAQKRAYLIADNRIAEEAGWDRDILAVEFAELEALDFDLSLTGFDAHNDGDDSAGVSAVDMPKTTKTVWALVGVPVRAMGELTSLIERAQKIEGAIVEVCEES